MAEFNCNLIKKQKYFGKFMFIVVFDCYSTEVGWCEVKVGDT